MQALLGRDGTTEVVLSTGNLEEPWWGEPGMITRVQAKVSSPDGKHILTQNDRLLSAYGRAWLPYPGVPRGAVMEVQGHVTGIDGNRTDVVTVTGPVLRRPNLAVVEVSAPARARAGTPINVAATIRETNGDLGSWGACGLYANGVQVDWSQGIWVDAGDVVTCVFTHIIRSAGSVRLEVRLGDSYRSPYDDNFDDNVGEVTVESFVTNEIFYLVSASEITMRDSSVNYERWRIGQSGDEHWTNRVQSARMQTVRLNAWMPREVSPDQLSMEITETVGGGTVARTFLPTPYFELYGGIRCGQLWDERTWGAVFLCTSPWDGGSTSFSYERHAGSATYHSYHYSRYWYGMDSQEYFYTENEAYGWGGEIPLFGDQLSMRIRLYDGEQVFTADPVVPLHATEREGTSPLRCYTYEDPWWDYSRETCSGGTSWSRTVSGQISG
jgi:hypothetical protein